MEAESSTDWAEDTLTEATGLFLAHLLIRVAHTGFGATMAEETVVGDV